MSSVSDDSTKGKNERKHPMLDPKEAYEFEKALREMEEHDMGRGEPDEFDEWDDQQYAPAFVAGYETYEKEEYIPVLENTNENVTSDEYIPVAITPRACDQISEQEIKPGDASSSSSEDEDYEKMVAEFRPKVEKVRETLTPEEKIAFASPCGKHDLKPSELPPIPDVSGMTIPDCAKIELLGHISSIMFEPSILAIVASTNTSGQPLDQGSVVFRKDRIPIGVLFETFGPVKSPFHSIRFKSKDYVNSFNLQVGDEIYFAHEFAVKVQVEMLKRQKGCDASWQDDEECPTKFLDHSDDEAEQKSKAERKAAAKAKRGEQVEKQPKKKDIDPDLSVYICGLPVDFRESTIKDLFNGIGIATKKVKLLRTATGETRCAAIINLRSCDDVSKSIEKLNMRITLPGAQMPLAVKQYEERKNSTGDLDRPTGQDYKVTFASNRSTITRGTKRTYCIGPEKEANSKTQHTLHSVQPDTDGVIGVDHAFVKKVDPASFTKSSNSPRASIVLTGAKGKKEAENSSKMKAETEDVFSWGAEVSRTTKNPYAAKRSLPPELLNPEAHPSPYDDPKRKKPSATVLNTGFSGSQVTSGPTLGIVSADYASSDEDFSETEDVENPSFSMFCEPNSSRDCPIERRPSTTTPTPSDARRDFKKLNSLFERATRPNRK